MKAFILFVTIFSATIVNAAELKVMEISREKLEYNTVLSTRFDVNMTDRTAGVKVYADTTTGWGDGQTTTTEVFKTEVPELSLNGDILQVNIDGVVVDCGVMKISRIFKRPVLHLNGNCDIKTRRAAKVVNVLIVTK